MASTWGPRGPVSRAAADRAAAWCEYLAAHARRLYATVTDPARSRSSWASAMALRNTARTAFLQGSQAGSGGRPRSSRADLAKKTGVTEASVAMTESGTRKNPSLPTLTRLARALGVQVTELLE